MTASTLELIVVNLAGKSRIEQRNGKRYIVAPITLIVPGVLNGNQGPLYYPQEEIEKNVDDWNGVPIVVNHPEVNGHRVTARSPNVKKIGTIYSSEFKGKLIAEAWFDPRKTQKADERILNSLEDNIPMEASTGLVLTKEPAEADASFNGVAYNFTARNYKPDHLAIVPDGRGACSLDDGCGLLVNKNESPNKESNMAKLSTKKRSELLGAIVENCECSDEDVEVLGNLSDNALKAMKESYDETEKLATNNEQLELVANAAKKGFECPEGNTHTYNEKTQQFETVIKEPEKKEKEEAARKKKEEEVNNETNPQTYEEWMATAPEEVKQAVENSRKIEAGEKRRLVDKIIFSVEEGDARTKLSKRLMDKPLVELEEMSILAPKQDEAPPVTANYGGQAVPANNQQPTFDKTDILGIPTMEYEDVT